MLLEKNLKKGSVILICIFSLKKKTKLWFYITHTIILLKLLFSGSSLIWAWLCCFGDFESNNKSLYLKTIFLCNSIKTCFEFP